jgi:hypothetical protein
MGGLRHIWVIGLMGSVAVALQILLFFLGIKLLGATIILIAFPASLVLIAFLFSTPGDDLSALKVLYLLLLSAAIVYQTYVIFAAGAEAQLSATQYQQAILFVPLLAATLVFFNISADRDTPSPQDRRFHRQNPRYGLVRTLFRVGLMLWVAAVTLVPMAYLTALVDASGAVLADIALFYVDFGRMAEVFREPNLYVLIVFATIIPYSLFYTTQSTWPRTALSFDQWASLLQVIEPMVGLVVGTLFLGEFFPAEALLIVVFLQVASIFLRYASETDSKVEAVVLLTLRHGHFHETSRRVRDYRDVTAVASLIGAADLLVTVKCSNNRRFNKTVLKIVTGDPGITRYTVFPITHSDLDRRIN